MNPFIKRELEIHKKELAEIKARNTPLIDELEKEREDVKERWREITKEITKLRQQITMKEYYIGILEKSE